jgi:predicted RNase H-like HicB family nuclease
MAREFQVIVKRYEQGYVAHAVGFLGAVVGEGDTYDEALADVTSAIRCAIETFGEEAFDSDFPLLDVSLAAAVAATRTDS